MSGQENAESPSLDVEAAGVVPARQGDARRNQLELSPVVNFKQRDSFVVEGWAAFEFTFAGWLLAAIVVAGLAGRVQAD